MYGAEKEPIERNIGYQASFSKAKESNNIRMKLSGTKLSALALLFLLTISLIPTADSNIGRIIKQIVGKMGPSGKPMRHNVQYPSRKAAQDGARNQGKGNPPIQHNGHYHGATKDGEKRLPNVHHNYPKRG